MLDNGLIGAYFAVIDLLKTKIFLKKSSNFTARPYLFYNCFLSSGGVYKPYANGGHIVCGVAVTKFKRAFNHGVRKFLRIIQRCRF